MTLFLAMPRDPGYEDDEDHELKYTMWFIATGTYGWKDAPSPSIDIEIY